MTNASESGADYVQSGETGDVLLDLVNRTVNSQSQVGLIFGSDSDTGDPGLAAAVVETLTGVKALAPDAAVVMAGPTSESDDAQGRLTQIRQTLSQQAEAIEVQSVDPVDLGWFQGAAVQYISTVLEHPNAAG